VAPEEKGTVRCDSGKDGKAILVLVTVDKPKRQQFRGDGWFGFELR